MAHRPRPSDCPGQRTGFASCLPSHTSFDFARRTGDVSRPFNTHSFPLSFYTIDMRAPVALLAVLFTLFALVPASSSTHSSSGTHGLVKRACATKTCLTNEYIAQSKAVIDARVAVQQIVAAEKKVAAQLKRALKGGKKFARKVNAFK
jgi:hypothetical protein